MMSSSESLHNDRPTQGLTFEEERRIPSEDAADTLRVPGRYSALAASSTILFVGIGFTNTFGVFQEYYQSTAFPHEPPSKFILIGSTASSLYLFLGAPIGRFVDLIGYRPSLLIGTALMIAAMFAASLSTTYIELWLTQGVMFGLGIAFGYLPAISVIRQYWKQNHGVANAVVVSGGALGGTVLPYIVRRLIVSVGLPQTFRVLGYIAIAGLVPSILVLRPVKPTVPLWKRPNGEARPPVFDLSLLRDSRFNALLVASSIAMVGFLPRYFLITESAVVQGVDQTYTPWLLGIMNGLSIVGRIGVGWFADRFGKVSALTLSFVLCGLGHFAFWLPAVTVPYHDHAATTALFTAFVVYTGIFGSGFVSLIPVVVSHLFGAEALASKQGLLNTMIGLGTFVGPSAIYGIVGNGSVRRWAAGVMSAGSFMLTGGIMLAFLFSPPFKLLERRKRNIG